MATYEIGENTLHINEQYEQNLGEEQVEKVVSLLSRITLPEDEAGMICLDHVIQKDGLLILVALYNNESDVIEEEGGEIHLHNGERVVVASGKMPAAAFPVMKKGDVHFWHFFLPHSTFIVSDVKLGSYYVEVIGQTEGQEDREYSFYHIMQGQKVEEKDLRARVTLMGSPIEYTEELSLTELTKKKTEEE